MSFGSVAADYDRYRPAPPPQALDWLVPPGAQAILDLAAGTGVVTRELVGRAQRIVAVEPDARGCPASVAGRGRGSGSSGLTVAVWRPAASGGAARRRCRPG